MPRPRRDGSPPKPRAKLRLTDRFVKTVAAPGPDRTLYLGCGRARPRPGRPAERPPELAVHVPRRRAAAGLHYRANRCGRPRRRARPGARPPRAGSAGTDPQAEKRRGVRAETFADVAARHIEHAQRVNKSWRQSDALVEEAPATSMGQVARARRHARGRSGGRAERHRGRRAGGGEPGAQSGERDLRLGHSRGDRSRSP